jgi:hypothetical protein
MAKLTPKELIEMARQPDLSNTAPLQQPRGLSVPIPRPPADLAATPGVEDSAERAAQRATLIAKVRKQQEELPIVAADQAFRGAVAGGVAGLACLLLRGLCTSRPPEICPHDEEYYDE